MDNFEKFIIEQKDEINNDLPHEGHFERFEMRLNDQNKHKKRINTSLIAAVAAVLVLAFIVLKPGNTATPFTLSDVSEQYAEVEFYYVNHINKQTELLKTIANNDSLQSQSMSILLNEMEEYDATYEQLCSDLEATPNDERVINALITYYQTKLEIVNRILLELENKRKDTENEKNITI